MRPTQILILLGLSILLIIGIAFAIIFLIQLRNTFNQASQQNDSYSDQTNSVSAPQPAYTLIAVYSTLRVYSNWVTPPNDLVDRGEVITWINTDSTSHTLYFSDGTRIDIGANQSTIQQFNTPGKLTYYIDNNTGFTGQITVRDV